MTDAEFNDPSEAVTPEAWDGWLTEECEMINQTDNVGDNEEGVDAEDQDGDDSAMSEAVEPEEQAVEALDADAEEGEEDNAIEIEELWGALCSGRRRTHFAQADAGRNAADWWRNIEI